MFCKNCGQSYDDAQKFCTKCGQDLTEGANEGAENNFGSEPLVNSSESAQLNPVIGKFVSAFSDNLFMIICILISVSAVISLLNKSLNVISILLAIFMWLTYVDSKKGVANSKYMRFTSGTVYANTIVMWVLCGCMALLALVSVAASGLLSTALYDVLGDAGVLFSTFGAGAGILIFVAFVIAAGVVALFNIFFFIPAHKLAKSMYTSVDTGVLNIENVSKIKVWAIVLGILNGISALSSISDFDSFLAAGCTAAAYIVTYIWLGKHFEGDKVYYNAN